MRRARLPQVTLLLLLTFSLNLSTASAGRRQALASGTVIDQDGKPLVGVSVVVYRTDRTAGGQIDPSGGFAANRQAPRPVSQSDVRTKDDGAFVHPGLYPDIQYRVRFEKDGYVPREQIVMLHVAGNDLGTIVMVSGDIERARDAYERGFSAYESGDLQGAIGPMLEVVDIFGDADVSDEMLVVALGVLGQAFLQQNQADEAQVALERLQSIEPGNGIALRGLGRVYAMGGDIPRAIESFAGAVEAEPDNANGRFLLGYALQLTGQAAAAIPHLRASIEIQPDFPPAHQSLGLALADTGADAEAIEHLEAYLQATPNAPDAAQMRAKIEELRR